MPPEEKYTADVVADAAFELLQAKGFNKLTARNVAAQLGSSTAPVYNHFSSIKELTQHVLGMANDLLLDYTTRPYTENIFLNMGVGYTVFARDRRKLFHALYLRSDARKDKDYDYTAAFRQQVSAAPQLETLNDEDRDKLLFQMALFTHGLATMVWAGLVEDDSEEAIIKTLFETGFVVVEAALKASREKDR